MEKPRTCIAVVRIRGVTGVKGDVQDTLKMLNLPRNYNATLIDDRPSYAGMLRKVQNHVTWGEVSKETVALLLKERGEIVGNKRLTDEYAQKVGYASIDKLAEAIYNLEIDFKSFPDIKPVFRLHPPRKGFKRNVKKSYLGGGETGYRGEAIDEIIRRMI